jgi:hypothetical protein
MSFLGLLKFVGLMGTGFAHANKKDECIITSKRGSIIVPNKSM